jgi:hypothetical protein
VTTPLDPVDASLDGKLVHVQGEGAVAEALRDEALGISRVAVRLKRKVEMYQWIERGSRSRSSQNKQGRARTPPRYETRWDDDLHESEHFSQPEGHRNPSTMEFSGKEWSAQSVQFGPRSLSPGLMGRWKEWDKLELTEKDLGNGLFRGPMHVWDGGFYRGDNPRIPEIGDLRIAYEVVKPGPVTVVAKQDGASFQAYPTRSGDELEILYTGTLSVDEVFTREHDRNTMFTWVGRFLGFLGMWIGVGMFFDPLRRMASWIPLIGGLLESSIGFVSFLLAASLTLVILAVAWFAVRPMLSLGLLVGAVTVVLGGKSLAK